MRGVGKSYGPVVALSHADLDLYVGVIHGLVGENGAGKSTLVRILAGIEAPDAGTVEWAERSRRGDRSVALVPQYPRMAGSLPLWRNLIIGTEERFGPFLAAGRSLRRVERVAERYRVHLDLEKPAADLTANELRPAALLAALIHEPTLLIVDEPTVGLPADERHAILEILRAYCGADRAVLYISHNLGEVAGLCDAVTPLVAGRSLQVERSPISEERLATLLFGAGAPAGAATHAVHGARSATGHAGVSGELGRAQSGPADGRDTASPPLVFERAVIRNPASLRSVGPIQLTAAPGTITAVAGVREAGLDVLEQFCAGEAVVESGAVRLHSVPLAPQVDPAHLRRHGMVFIPSDRFDRAAALSGSVEDNAIVQERLVIHPRGLRTSRRVRETMHRLTERFDVHARRGDPLTALSGGTIQKLILARELDGDPSVCVLAEPTAGLDLRSQRALAETLRQLAEGGAAVIVLTSSLHIFDVLRCTVHVLHAGRVVGTFPSTDEHGVARAIAGIGAETPSPPNGVSAP